MLLGDSPHLDGQYAIFGKVAKGDKTLKALEELPTRREGIFVMWSHLIIILWCVNVLSSCLDRIGLCNCWIVVL
ncbi:unnamed protein product [Prunus brigantina]